LTLRSTEDVGIGGRELFYVPKCDRFMVLEPRSVRLREAAGAGNVARVGAAVEKAGGGSAKAECGTVPAAHRAVGLSGPPNPSSAIPASASSAVTESRAQSERAISCEDAEFREIEAACKLGGEVDVVDVGGRRVAAEVIEVGEGEHGTVSCLLCVPHVPVEEFADV
jgi:hypothetical protein